MMRTRSSTAVAAVVAAVVFGALTSCSSDSDDESSPAGSTAASGSGAPVSAPPPTPTLSASASPTPPPSPSPTGPCADGDCEIEVAVGDIVNVPSSYGLGPIEVRAITADSVEMVAPLTGSGYSIANCNGGGAVSSDGSGAVRFACDKRQAGTINHAMSLEIVETRGTTAVIRIKPAA